KKIPSLLESFDFPQMNPNCIERKASTVAVQALHLMNNGMVEQLAGAFARRVAREAGLSPERQIEHAWLLALGRRPTAKELRVGIESLHDLQSAWREQGNSETDADQSSASIHALTTFCHAILNSAAFLYID